MLKTIQILALIQGIFLLMVLFVKRDNYKRLNFWLMFVTIVSLLFHIIGDDDFNLLQTDANWYIFHAPLIVTLFFLLIRYHNSPHSKFQIKDLLYFIPYVIFVGLQYLETYPSVQNTVLFRICEGTILIVMFYYIGYTIYDVLKNKKEHWMLFFIIPYCLVYLLDTLPYFITGEHDTIPFLESYGVIGLSALLLYFILFKLVVAPKTVLPKAETTGYKTSSLHNSKVALHKEAFLKLMHDDQLYLNSTITVNEVAKLMGIPRQHLSEVLNVHMKSSFQDYVNKCRAEAFVTCLKNTKYDNYTIMGIATEVGFKSKSSFNTTFKKLYGVTPSAFKKSLSSE